MPRRLEAIRVRLHLSPDQASLLRRIWGSLRMLYNLALEQRSTFGRNGRRITYETCGECLRHPVDERLSEVSLGA